MTRPYRYTAGELQEVARLLEPEPSEQRRALGRHLRLVADAVADAVAEVDAVDGGRSSKAEECRRIALALGGKTTAAGEEYGAPPDEAVVPEEHEP